MRRPYTQLYCHAVWATEGRAHYITSAAEPRLHGAIRAKLNELKCVPIAIGGMPDHVHCLFGFPPTVALSHVVQQIKGSSSHFATHELGLAEFAWQGAYGAFTVGREDLEAVQAYVLGQRAHHSENTVWPEFEKTFLEDEAM